MAVNANDFGLLSPTYKNISASALIKTGYGRLRGIFVSSIGTGQDAPTIKLWDNTSAATTILVNTFSPTAPTYYNLADVAFGTGLYVTLTNTIDCTVFYF
jgi:hypothetical protein